MRCVVFAGLIMAALAGTPLSGYGQSSSDGAVIRQSDAFPFTDLDAWVAASKGSAEFNEAAFRKSHSREEVARFVREVECLRVGYRSGDLTIEGFILKPRALKTGEKRPVIIYNRGGNQFLAIIDQEKLYSLRKFVLAGYVVVASQYRGGGGSEGQDEF
ncbi:MAG: hypothetical protein PHI34_03910, partial [Acidobacteriota bacterium]|nr:hypothetical protein [Acidobacteriota bacterium]